MSIHLDASLTPCPRWMEENFINTQTTLVTNGDQKWISVAPFCGEQNVLVAIEGECVICFWIQKNEMPPFLMTKNIRSPLDSGGVFRMVTKFFQSPFDTPPPSNGD